MFIKLYYQPRPRSASRDRVTACQTYATSVMLIVRLGVRRVWVGAV